MWRDRNKNQVSGIAVALFAISFAAGFGLTTAFGNRMPLFAGLLTGVYLLFSIKVADQWEKVAVLRLGRYIGLRGPGLFHVIPIVDTLSRYVDQRVRVASVTAESTLTRDTVPVNVDAIVFWLVWNAEKSILEVEDFVQAINMSAQTGLRESIGRHELAQMITERESLGRELQHILDENPGRAYPAGAGGRNVPPGPGRARAPGAQHPGTGGNRDLGKVRAGGINVSAQPGRTAFACDEHAV
jgi:hypothetical protein